MKEAGRRHVARRSDRSGLDVYFCMGTEPDTGQGRRCWSVCRRAVEDRRGRRSRDRESLHAVVEVPIKVVVVMVAVMVVVVDDTVKPLWAAALSTLLAVLLALLLAQAQQHGDAEQEPAGQDAGKDGGDDCPFRESLALRSSRSRRGCWRRRRKCSGRQSRGCDCQSDLGGVVGQVDDDWSNRDRDFEECDHLQGFDRERRRTSGCCPWWGGCGGKNRHCDRWQACLSSAGRCKRRRAERRDRENREGDREGGCRGGIVQDVHSKTRSKTEIERRRDKTESCWKRCKRNESEEEKADHGVC